MLRHSYLDCQVQASLELCNARGRIQAHYLGELKSSPEVTDTEARLGINPIATLENKLLNMIGNLV